MQNHKCTCWSRATPSHACSRVTSWIHFCLYAMSGKSLFRKKCERQLACGPSRHFCHVGGDDPDTWLRRVLPQPSVHVPSHSPTPPSDRWRVSMHSMRTTISKLTYESNVTSAEGRNSVFQIMGCQYTRTCIENVMFYSFILWHVDPLLGHGSANKPATDTRPTIE
jgi:hypothetical protein